jgi:hypothetical protein
VVEELPLDPWSIVRLFPGLISLGCTGNGKSRDDGIGLGLSINHFVSSLLVLRRQRDAHFNTQTSIVGADTCCVH